MNTYTEPTYSLKEIRQRLASVRDLMDDVRMSLATHSSNNPSNSALAGAYSDLLDASTALEDVIANMKEAGQ
jgi:hypothetical protein